MCLPSSSLIPRSAPDALDQVKRAIRSIFRRNKKPQDDSASSRRKSRSAFASLAPTPARALSPLPIRAQTPEPSAYIAARLAAAEPEESSVANESERRSPLQETTYVDQPTFPSSEPPPIPPISPRRDHARELSSSPRSPSIPTMSHPEFAPAPLHIDTEDGAYDDRDGDHANVGDVKDAHFTRDMITHNDNAVEQDTCPTITVSQPHDSATEPQSAFNFDIPPEEPVIELFDSEDSDVGRAIPLGEDEFADKSSTPPPTETSHKYQSSKDATDILPPPRESQDEYHQQANETARRAPALYHDEKIPVMAEPPSVRRRTVAPGMVATSGPLEDFPFR